MINCNGVSGIDDYYKYWNKSVNSKGTRYDIPLKLGRGYLQLIGDVNSVFVSIADYVEYHPPLLRSYLKEQIVSIADVQSAKAHYYRNKRETKALENGFNCRINALPTVIYSKAEDNSCIKSIGLVIRESFLRMLPIEQYELEQMAYYLNGRPVYNSSLLFLFKQLRNIPVADRLIPLYLQAKATEVVSLLLNLTLAAKDKPKLTKDNLENLRKVKEFLDNQFIAAPSIEKLTGMFYINKNLLQAGFKNLTGHTVYEYITHLKINYAVELLLSTNMSVEAIAEKVGYKSKMNFYNAFKREFLLTPNELRVNNKNQVDI